MKVIYQDEEITIEGGLSTFILRTSEEEYTLEGRSVYDTNGHLIMKFKTKSEFLWDIKLMMGKETQIGKYFKDDQEIKVYAKGAKDPSIIVDGKEIIARDKGLVKLGKDFDIENKEHLALLLIMTAAHATMD
jgi:hypothetical protein